MEFEKKKYPSKFVPMGAIVTVSGTGSEMNNGAVITHEDKKMKSGLLGGYAKFCVLNPKYTLSVPLKQMISGACDTLSHAMETYFGKNECVSDDISIAIMKNTIKILEILFKNLKIYIIEVN